MEKTLIVTIVRDGVTTYQKVRRGQTSGRRCIMERQKLDRPETLKQLLKQSEQTPTQEVRKQLQNFMYVR